MESTRKGVAVKSGKYINDMSRRTIPDLTSGNYELPCDNAKFLVRQINGKPTGRITADEYIDRAETKIAEAINAITMTDSSKHKRTDDAMYLDDLFQLLKEALFAKARFGGGCVLTRTEYYLTKFHNRSNNYYQGARK